MTIDQHTPTTTPLAADSTPGACTVRSTTGTAPITFTAVRPAGTVRIDLEDGSSQVYDYRAVSRALFATTAAGPDVLGYGPSLGYEPTTTPTTPTTPCPAWCQTDHDGTDAPELHDGPSWPRVPATGGYFSAQVSTGTRENGDVVVYLEAPGLVLTAEDARTAGRALLAAVSWAEHHAGAR